MADSDSPRVSPSYDHINADKHLVHANVGLRLIDRSLGACPRGPEVNDVLGLLRIREAFRARRQNDPRSLPSPLRAAQHTWIVPRSLPLAVSTQRTELLTIERIRHLVLARRKEADPLMVSREDNCVL